MFRDLKEYQQIQKIYEERVCISEEDRYITKELEETFTEDELNFIVENTEEVFAEISNQLVEEGSEIAEETIDEMAKAVAKAAIPLAKKVGSGLAKKVAGGGGLMKKAGGLIKKGVGFVKKNAAKVAGAVGIGGAAAGAAIATRDKKPTDAKPVSQDSPDSPETPETPVTPIRKIDPKQFDNRRKPESGVSKFTKQGKPRTKAQMMAAKRLAAGKTIADVKAENKAKMIANARARNVDFKAKRRKPPGEMKSNFAGGVSGKGKATDDFSKDPKYQSTAGKSTDVKKKQTSNTSALNVSSTKKGQMMNKEEFTPYDIVLEYLLSSQQAATIEEANYIMTEMDAKTIQDIVS